MISFAYPGLLYLLLIIPALAALFWLSRIARTRKLRRYGRPEVLASLMPDASRYMPWVKLTVALLALAFMIIVLARPRAKAALEDSARETETSRGIEVMVCLDVSNSMLASSTDDPRGVARLDRAKHLLERLVGSLRDDRVGLIVFAGDAYVQLPITTDYVSANMFINSVSTNMVPTQGTAIGSAIDMALESFTPDTKTGRAIIVITDGENFEDDAVESAARAADAGVIVDIIGLGTASGAPILIDRDKGVYMTDSQGQQVITALNAAEAQKIAKAGKGIYVSGNSSNAIGDINSQLDTLAKTDFMRTTFSPASEQFPAFAVLALILLIIDALTPTRKITWLTKFNFFTSNKPRTK